MYFSSWQIAEFEFKACSKSQFDIFKVNAIKCIVLINLFPKLVFYIHPQKLWGACLKPLVWSLYHPAEGFTKKSGVLEDSEITLLSSCSIYYLVITSAKPFCSLESLFLTYLL